MDDYESDPILVSLHRIRAANTNYSACCTLSYEDNQFLQYALDARRWYMNISKNNSNIDYHKAFAQVQAAYTTLPYPHVPGYAESIVELREHGVRTADITAHGTRSLHCDPTHAKAGTETSIVEEHIHQNHNTRLNTYPDWYDTSSESPNVETTPPNDPPRVFTEKYSFDFLGDNNGAGKEEHAMWRKLAFQARTEATSEASYFSSWWSISTLEKLRLDTINWFYSEDRKPALYTVPPTQEEMVATELTRLTKHNLLGKDDQWKSMYTYAIQNYFAKAPGVTTSPPLDYANTMHEKEIKNRVGEANDLFVWRLVIVHLRTLRIIGCPEDVPLTSCFDMHSLLQNVAHLIKYRRCIKWAKSIYKTAGVGSLHDQHRAKLLNVQFAHAHQDESDTEIGVARRILRQAHVSNYVQYMQIKEKSDESKPRVDMNVDEQSVPLQPRATHDSGPTYHAEKYLTNPPMAPIVCSAPPRMGKSALSMLMASFAVKLGGTVLYGVAPNKRIPEAEMSDRLASLTSKMIKMPMFLYSYDTYTGVIDANKKLQSVANTLNGWVLHIRDEAHNLAICNDESVNRLEHLQNTYPILYGMNMCVSATILPVMGITGLVGNDESIRNLLETVVETKLTRSDREKCVVLQGWSFPIGPDFLVPPKTAFPQMKQAVVSTDDWYNNFYRTETVRSTNYYGMWFHIEDHPATLISENGVLIDSYLQDALKENQAWFSLMQGTTGRRSAKILKVISAYAEFLKHFNKYNTRFWKEEVMRILPNGPTRVANIPIEALTEDAGHILSQAQTWMRDEPLIQSQEGANPMTLHPMLVISTLKNNSIKNGKLELAVLLCKLSWLRMHNDYVSMRLRRDTSPDELALRYGLTVIVQTNIKVKESLIGVVAKSEDIHNITTHSDMNLLSITFDPRLPENRFEEHVFVVPDSSGTLSLPVGTLHKSILVPELTPRTFIDYMQAYDTLKKEDPTKGLSAYEFLRDGSNGVKPIGTRLYRFDSKHFYNTWERQETANVAEKDNGDGGGGRYAQETEVSDAMDAVYSKTPQESATPPQMPNNDPPDLWKRTTYTNEDGEYVEYPEDIDSNHPIENLNAIALRLCVNGSRNVQTATETSITQCNIGKIALVGWNMLTAGFNLQTTTESKLHIFVPKYMSIALDALEYGERDLSLMYQAVGRGFVDMKIVNLPSDWKLQLLSISSVRSLCKLYGNAELLLSQIHNESTEGRKMTLGTTLESIKDSNGAQTYSPLDKEELRSCKTDKSGTKLKDVLDAVSDDDDGPRYRPFMNVRDCLVGENAPSAERDSNGTVLLTEKQNQPTKEHVGNDIFNSATTKLTIKRYETPNNFDLTWSQPSQHRITDEQRASFNPLSKQTPTVLQGPVGIQYTVETSDSESLPDSE